MTVKSGFDFDLLNVFLPFVKRQAASVTAYALHTLDKGQIYFLVNQNCRSCLKL